ncbi:HAMP domain-containing protein [Alkalicella caledoniensis]|uniref:histidine kinase n=1 Tax=Alkalicella caledoniensis TaxID=2731377 RepID=A0A7G9W8M6_ALKCA|nr:ATP-binding protein [Alkalicella caledoniensis]QNO15038.1 HAMP domain-containing protein [Alkalicella caledoniensis]
MVKSIQYKLILIYVLLLLFAFQVLGVFLIQSLENYYLAEFKDGIKSQGQLLSSFVSRHLYEKEYDITTINQLVREFSQPITMADIYIISNSGIVVSASRGKERYVNTRVVQHEVTRAIMGTPGEAVRPNPETGSRDYFYATPVFYEQSQVGTIYIVASLISVDNTLAKVRNILIIGTLSTMLLTAALGIFVAKTITQPIEDVTQKAEAMAKGNYEGKIAIKSDDEIGQLGSVFNYLAEKLEESIGEISDQKNKTEAILQNLTDGVVAFNKDGDVIHQNPLIEKLLATKDSSKLREILLYDEKNLADLLKNEDITQKQREVNGKTLLLNYVTFSSEHGSSGLIVVVNDITQREQLEYMRRQFVADVSHELRTPLTSIKSYVEALLNGGIEDREISEKFLRVVEDETQRMVRMVKDLLMITRLDYNKESWHYGTIDMEEFFESLTFKVLPQLDDKNQILTKDIEKNIPIIRGDIDKLQQLFINLLTNASKYSPEGNQIKTIVKRYGNDSISIVVEDKGIGIPKEDLPRIFERFYRVDKARSRELGGTGLGLSIVKQVVDGHRGHITIDSEEGKGTSVKVILPIAPAVEEDV